MPETFDYSLTDAQATPVRPVTPEEFDYDAFLAREAEMAPRCRAFWSSGGILVHRRMRVAEVFSSVCGDQVQSLRLQLGGLAASLDFEGDCPNFLEPWYGIGAVAAAFGAEYSWEDGQAPAVRPRFSDAQAALAAPARPVSETSIGRRTLEMIEYFLDETKGRLPVSLGDMQSPFNTACQIVGVNRLLLDMVDDPDTVRSLLLRIADLLVDFVRKQIGLLGNALVWPGHGFTSNRAFEGLGFSDDNILMVSPKLYREVIRPSVARLAEAFGGVCFHSCGNWSRMIPLVLGFPGVRMIDGAFTARTDPSPNPAGPFAEVLPGRGIVLNARMAGSVESVVDTAAALWRPGSRLIVVTYCPTPADQAVVYRRLRALADAPPPAGGS